MTVMTSISNEMKMSVLSENLLSMIFRENIPILKKRNESNEEKILRRRREENVKAYYQW